MQNVPDIKSITEKLISIAYPELEQSKITVSWGKIPSYAQVQWSGSPNKISIRINDNAKIWHEAGVIGLISHELSHPAQKESGLSESRTDEDTISRGLGVYLAVERLFAGKYEDYLIYSGKDRYLGYRSIKSGLSQLEIQQLSALLSKIELIPKKPKSPIELSHDILIFGSKRRTSLTVDGHQFILPHDMKEPDIKLVDRNYIRYIYADEILVGKIEVGET